MSAGCRRSPALLLSLTLGLSAAPSLAADRDPLADARERMAVEAQRVEKVFSERRAAAYKLVRRDSPRLVEAVAELHGLLATLRADTALEAKRRETLIVTVKWDLGKVREIAEERTRFARAEDARALARDARREGRDRRDDDPRRTTRAAESVLESRGRAVADARGDRGRFNERATRVMRSVDEAAMPVARTVTFPPDWVEKSKRRSSETKLTAKERAILEALKKVISVDFTNNTFGEIKEYLEKLTGVTIALDPQGLRDANVSPSESTVTLKMRSSTRTVLKRLLADLGLAYVIKDEAILITSVARAREMTTTRTYYIGDLASVVDLRVPPLLAQVQMIQTINQLTNLITSTVEPQSWKVNNPDAPGTIVFEPRTMTLIIRQSAEMHYEMSKSFRR
jgi:hypothetical protein